jgi:hypothetical protein
MQTATLVLLPSHCIKRLRPPYSCLSWNQFQVREAEKIRYERTRLGYLLKLPIELTLRSIRPPFERQDEAILGQAPPSIVENLNRKTLKTTNRRVGNIRTKPVTRMGGVSICPIWRAKVWKRTKHHIGTETIDNNPHISRAIDNCDCQASRFPSLHTILSERSCARPSTCFLSMRSED